MYNYDQPWVSELDWAFDGEERPDRLSRHEAPDDDWGDATGDAD